MVSSVYERETVPAENVSLAAFCYLAQISTCLQRSPLVFAHKRTKETYREREEVHHVFFCQWQQIAPQYPSTMQIQAILNQMEVQVPLSFKIN